MSENIINAIITIFCLFFGFILGSIYGWFQGFKDAECLKEERKQIKEILKQ